MSARSNNPGLHLPPQFRIPVVVQGLMDRVYGELFAEIGVTEEELLADERVSEDIINSKYEKVYGRDIVAGCIENTSEHFTRTRYFLGGSAVRIADINTPWEQLEPKRHPSTWHDYLDFGMKVVKIEALTQQTMKKDEWQLHVSPDGPPALMHNDDIQYATRATKAEDEIVSVQAVTRTFGPEAVTYITDNAAVEVINLLTNPANQWQVASVIT